MDLAMATNVCEKHAKNTAIAVTSVECEIYKPRLDFTWHSHYQQTSLSSSVDYCQQFTICRSNKTQTSFGKMMTEINNLYEKSSA